MNRTRKSRVIAVIVLITLLATTEYNALYEVVMAASTVRGEDTEAVGETTAEPEADAATDAEAMLGTAKAAEPDTVSGAGVNAEDDLLTDADSMENDMPSGDNTGWVETSGENVFADTVSGNEPQITISEDDLLTLSPERGVDYGESSIPTDVDEFKEWYKTQSGQVSITTLQDWLNFCALSKKDSLKGYVFQIENNRTPNAESTNVHDLTILSASSTDPDAFTGIGSTEYPFQGTLTCYLGYGISLKTKVPVFACLGGGSHLSRLSIICVQASSAAESAPTSGLAQTVTGTGEVALSNITISGSIWNANGSAGALFGTVENTENDLLTITVTKENNTGVTLGQYNNAWMMVRGCYAGAIAGVVQGRIKWVFDADLYDLSGVQTVTGLKEEGASALLFGKVAGKDELHKAEIILKNSKEGAEELDVFGMLSTDTTTQTKDTVKVYGRGMVGGLIGQMHYGVLDASSKKVVLNGSKSANKADIACMSAKAETSAVGGIVGVLENSEITQGSKFAVNNTYVLSAVPVKAIGGFFGAVINSHIPAGTDDETVFYMSNSQVLGNANCTTYAGGGICGYYQDDTCENSVFSNIVIKNSTVNVRQASGNRKSANGMVVGLFQGNNGSTLTISGAKLHGIFPTAVNGSGTGGMIGVASGDGTGSLTVKECVVDTSMDAETPCSFIGKSDGFMIWETNSAIGGVLGVLKAGDCSIENIEFPVLSMRTDMECGSVIGLIESSAEKKYVSIQDVKMNTLYWSAENYSGSKGLLMGKVGGNTIVRLGGEMKFENVIWYWTNKASAYPALGGSSYWEKRQYVGSIAGIQEKAVIYIDEGCTYEPYQYTSNGTNDALKVKYVDEIGNFGAAFRNGKWGSTQNVFDGKTITGSITKNGDTYELENVADLMRFAVVLNSEGAFGTDCFGADYTTLLSADYLLTGAQYDLADTGIVSLQRTIGKGTSASITKDIVPTQLTCMPELFSGSLCGSNASAPTEIRLNRQVYRQKNQGLFAYVGTQAAGQEAVFANLKLVESFKQPESAVDKNDYTTNSVDETGTAGGLSAYAQGTIRVENCQLTVDMQTRKYVSETINKAFLGGLFGQYKAVDGSVLTVSSVTADGEKVVRDNDHYVSQLIAGVESPYDVSSIPQMVFSDITISGSVKNENPLAHSYDKDVDSYLGAFIAVMNENKRDGTREVSWADGEEFWHTFTKERTKLSVKNLSVKNFSLTNAENTERSSGLLGFRWLDVNVSFENLTVGEAGSPNALTAYKRFGGLVNEVCGRMDVNRATISHTNVTSLQTGSYCGLLVAEAAQLYLSVKDYDVQNTTVVERSANKAFDEIAGASKQRNTDGSRILYDSFTESKGGVVSISKTGIAKSLLLSDYKSYQNSASYTIGGAALETEEITDKAVRYYYDIPEIVDPLRAGDLLDHTISTPEELVRFHLLQYSVSTLNSYFVTETEQSKVKTLVNQNYNLENTIDLNGYSYYPTTISHKTINGINGGATIVFHGQEIIDKESEVGKNRSRQPYNAEKPHYMLHSSLFYDIAAVTVSNLTLSGTVSEVQYAFSGALVCGSIRGVNATKDDEDDKLGHIYSTKPEDYTKISNITLNNLWVATKDNSCSSGYHGLLVASIVQGAKVNFDSIKMTGYDATNSPTRDTEKKAARALIAVVGKVSSGVVTALDSELQLSFQNMDIADVADATDLTGSAATPDLQNSTENDKVLASASFICYYYYYEDTSYSVYTFSKADYLSGKGLTAAADDPDNGKFDSASGSGLVTMGCEINEETEYIDENLTTKIVNDTYGFKNTNYKPYVYEKKEILVNPKPGAITKGCGTYEDPYVIESARQLKSLYYYLKDQTGQLINWRVNAIGDDTTFCNKVHEAADVKTYGKDAEFPTKAQLNQAYYMISPTADADGNRIIDLTDCEDFTGFGSLKEPFVGVMIGKVDTTGLPVIKLPGYVNNGNGVDTFGLVRYAKGCVVKDLTIELGTQNTGGTVYPTINGAGSAVIGTVCGGDNIVDNVTVKGTLKATVIPTTVGGESTYSTVTIGGYVGCVDLGTLIIRNVSQESLKDFCIKGYHGEDVTKNSAYLWMGGIVGRVKDGAVFYEGLADSTSPVLTSTMTSFAYTNTQGLSMSPNYDIINAAYLKDSAKCGKVQVEVAGNDISLEAKNAGELMLVTMALNTGCLTYVGDTESELSYRNGYGADARCRNGSYANVGNVTALTDADYVDAVTYDNLNGKQPATAEFFAPYVFDYVTSNGTVSLQAALLGTGATVAYNDPKVSSCYITMDANHFTLKLKAGESYDMTAFKNSFRGIGAGYFRENNTFKGNVEGNNSTIKISYISNNEKGIEDIGLFNKIVLDAQSDGCYMKDFTVTGTVLNADVTEAVSSLTDSLLEGDSISGKSAAGLIARLEIESNLDPSGFADNKYNYSFMNVKVKDMRVESQEYAGGMIGRLVCTPEGGKNSAYKNALYFESCAVGERAAGEPDTDYNTTIKARADVGGLIASYQDSVNVTMKDCKVSSVDLQARGMHLYKVKAAAASDVWLDRRVFAAAGGFIGRGVGAGKTISITGGAYDKVSLKAKGHMGGVIAETESTLLVNEENGTDVFNGHDISFTNLGTAAETYLADVDLIDTTLSNGVYDTYAACYNRTGYLGSFGGFAGFVSGPGTKLYHVTLTELKGTFATGRKDKTFIGGLVGRLYETGTGDVYTIADCHIGSEATNLSLKAGDAGINLDNDRVSVGGLVGDIECSAITQIQGCTVTGNSDGSSTLLATDTAAGMNALVETYYRTEEKDADGRSNRNIYYEDCKVKNLAVNAYVRVAGVEGQRVYPSDYLAIDIYSRFHEITVSDCTLYNMDNIKGGQDSGNNYEASGGIQAFSKGQTIAVNCLVDNVQMKGNTTYAAGGVSGRITGANAWLRAANTTVKNCTIAGACAGGLVGRIDKTNSNNVMLMLAEIQIEHNKIISHYYATVPQRVGGLFGIWVYGQGMTGSEDIEVRDNLIAALPINIGQRKDGNVLVGGLMGLVQNSVRVKSPTMENNIVTMLDKDALLGEVPAGMTLEDYLISDQFGIWNAAGEVDKDNVESVKPRLYNTVEDTYVTYKALDTEEDNKSYYNYVGLLFGRKDQNNSVWATDVKVSYKDALRIYRPAADVAGKLKSGPDYHIVYGEYEESAYKQGQSDCDNENIANALGLGSSYYQFGDLKKIWDDYKAQTDKKYAYRLANNYQGFKYTTKKTIEDVLSGTYYDESEGYRTIYQNAGGTPIPMLVYDNNSTMDEMINTAINVLTNNGGCLRESRSLELTTVTPIKMVVENGAVRKAEAADSVNYSIEPSIKITKDTETNGNQNLSCAVNSIGYDEQKDSKNGTFTVLKIDYNWSYSTGYNDIIYGGTSDKYTALQTTAMTLYVPVYVEKVLEYQTHIVGVQGAEYYLDNLLASGKKSIQTLRDTYTAYVEYDYNDAYTKYNSQMEKEIVYKHTGTGNDVEIPKGTRFVLIDISDNGHAYYYKVESNTKKVALNTFKDSNNNKYVEKTISSMPQDSMDKTLYTKHEDAANPSMPGDYYAVQQYILLVDSSEVSGTVANYAYNLTVQPSESNAVTSALLKRTIQKQCPKDCKLEITEYQGISGKFNTQNTSLTGEISPEDRVTINLDYDITAPGEYWNYLQANQGANLSQYLDVAIYLQKDGNKAALPSGTQVIFNEGTSQQAIGVVQGNTILYQYKDAGIQYDLNKLTGDVKLSGTVTLDFGGADFVGFENGQYTVVFELLKTKDANFPMGGEVLDTFTTTVKSTAEKNLGFVLETTDLLVLGMNGYLPETSDGGVIDCNVRFDFSDYLTALGQPTKEMKEMAGKYFTVQFEIQKKTKGADGSLSYEPYNGNLVQILYGDSSNAQTNSVDAGSVVYKFTENFMKNGYSPNGKAEKAVITFPYTVVADVDALLANYDTITNYRVIAKLYVTDTKPSSTAVQTASGSPEGCEIYVSPSVQMTGAESMKDYFVFSVAKIKTDLDIAK